jgi:stearoyl-CoA desaturase (delta-9 desaturase)
MQGKRARAENTSIRLVFDCLPTYILFYMPPINLPTCLISSAVWLEDAPLTPALPASAAARTAGAVQPAPKPAPKRARTALARHPQPLKTAWLWWDVCTAAYIACIHALACLAPATYSRGALAVFAVTYFLTACVGVTFCFHRCLTHHAFVLPKPVEYFCAYLGVLASQSDPLEWVSQHRLHHVTADTPADPHSPLQGLFWSHMGWLFDRAAVRVRLGSRQLVPDMLAQPYYVWLERTYELHVLGSVAALALLGGLPYVVWGYALRTVCVWHATFSVNSLAHVWGGRPYDTGDESRNNGAVAWVAFGEGWHNNHHAFPYSARHGLEWWQLDVTWALIRVLYAAGVVTTVRLPTAAERAKTAL